MTYKSILPLRLKNICLIIDNKKLINNVSIEFKANVRTIILGPNGAGKSLLLRLCHGLIKPTSGSVIWHGYNQKEASRLQEMVFQRPVMLRRSVLKNIDYVLSLKKIPKNQRPVLIDEALTLSGLFSLAHQPARSLSAGEQQKLALARAWATKPQVLFLDEPCANLDPGTIHAVEETIKSIHNHGTKIIMTTHDLKQAERLANEVLFFNKGKVVEHNLAFNFFKNPNSKEARSFLNGELLW